MLDGRGRARTWRSVYETGSLPKPSRRCMDWLASLGWSSARNAVLVSADAACATPTPLRREHAADLRSSRARTSVAVAEHLDHWSYAQGGCFGGGCSGEQSSTGCVSGLGRRRMSDAEQPSSRLDPPSPSKIPSADERKTASVNSTRHHLSHGKSTMATVIAWGAGVAAAAFLVRLTAPPRRRRLPDRRSDTSRAAPASSPGGAHAAASAQWARPFTRAASSPG